MPHSKPSFFWPLRLVVAITLIAPTLLFAYVTWQNDRELDQQADERIERALDVLQEHSLKALQTVERAISEINEVLRGLSDAQIRAREADLYLRFKRTQQALPQMEAIWAFDRLGHPLVSSTILPVPANLNNSDRSYFQAQLAADAGTYVGEVVRARVGSLRFFVVSGRRDGEPAGQFNGVIGVTVQPEHFNEFYRKLSRGRDSFALARPDGSLLARFPEHRLEAPSTSEELRKAVLNSPGAGSYVAVSAIDQIERRVGFRKVPGFEVYVVAGIETDAIRSEFLGTAARNLALGLPIVLTMFGLALYALKRALRVQEEAARREIAESALKQSQRLEAVGQLTGGVAHDFNNLLMIISGNAARLKPHVKIEDRARRALDAIESAARRGATLTRHLLSFSRRQTHEAKSIDLSELLAQMQEMLQASLRGNIVVKVDLPKGLWPVKADVSELELALLNLAINARDAMGAGGQLTLSAKNAIMSQPNSLELSGEFVKVAVVDNGAGIAPEILPRVFEPFFTTKDIDKGTGLGLSQVYGFTKQTGGAATVDSKLGEGTTVTLYLPRSVENPDREVVTRVEATSAGINSKRRVLLVEDNADVADVTTTFLEQLECVVRSVSDFSSATEMLRQPDFKPDLVISDIVMPGGKSGLDLARYIREEFSTKLPIILVTGYSSEAQAAADEGFSILRKPYTIADLRQILHDVTAR